MARDRGPTWDALFLAITREASVYGISVPLPACMIVAMSALASFGYSFNYNLWWRLLIVGSYVILSLGVMAALSTWEVKWFAILSVWCVTRAQGLLSRWTAAFGGTTYRPWPAAIDRDRAEMRDYAG